MEERYIKAIDPYKWVRPAGWLTMPTITSSQNKLAFLFAIYEDHENCFSISYGVTSVVANYTIDWGDGTTLTVVNLTTIREKRYDYASISSIVLQDANGDNYKQVIITATLNSGTIALWTICPTSPTIGAAGNRPGPGQILETIISHDGMVALTNTGGTGRVQPLMQSLTFKKMVVAQATGTYFSFLSNLRNIEGFSNITTTVGGSSTSAFIGLGPINPIDITWNGSNGGLGTFLSSGTFRELGNIDFKGTAGVAATFSNCFNLEKIGNINLNSNTTATSMFNGCNKLRQIGTITSPSNTSITSMFVNCFSVQSIVFSSCAAVTLATTPFTNCNDLRTLKMPGMSIGFSILNCDLDRTALVDLFNDLASGVTGQTIVISGNPGVSYLTAGELAIATGKGWTVTQ